AVPITTVTADSTSAAAADASHVSAAVASGPKMKIASVTTASSANALGISRRWSASSVAYALRSTDETVGSVAPVRNATGTSSRAGAPATASAITPSNPTACAAASQ